jgi:hypothetical protein
MNIREQLLVELSHFNMNYIANAIGTDPAHFESVMKMVLQDKDPVPPRAAWVAELVTQKDPALIKPYLGKIIEGLERYTHPGTRRNILKILMRTKIPEEYQGHLIDICFQWIMDEEKKVATKVFAMQIIENHLPEYPELAIELSEVIHDQFHKNSAGFKSRGRKVLKNLEKYL